MVYQSATRMKVVIAGGGIIGCAIAYYLTAGRRRGHYRRAWGARRGGVRRGGGTADTPRQSGCPGPLSRHLPRQPRALQTGHRSRPAGIRNRRALRRLGHPGRRAVAREGRHAAGARSLADGARRAGGVGGERRASRARARALAARPRRDVLTRRTKRRPGTGDARLRLRRQGSRRRPEDEHDAHRLPRAR